MSAVLRVIRCSEVVPDPERWVLTEEQVPESSPHDLLSERFRGLCRRWSVVTGRRVKVGRNLAVRWDRQHPQYGVDPDVYIVEPPPPEGDEVQSLRLWEPGPRAHGGPHRLQIWRRTDDAGLALVYAGDGPAWSEALNGWIRATEGARAYELSSDEVGEEIWMTPEEAEREEREAAERRAEAAERRIQELEAQLARGR